jgi:exoribonuclease R
MGSRIIDAISPGFSLKRRSTVARHWREALVPLLADPGYQPLDEKALARKLRVPPEEATAASPRSSPRRKKSGGSCRCGTAFTFCRSGSGFRRRLQMNERGFGFLVPIDPAEPDFYIAGEDTGTAFHGDLVLARLKEQRGRQRDSRLRGEVVKVLQRKRRQLVGTLRKTPMFYYVLPDETRIPHDISVPAPADEAQLGKKSWSN